MPKSLFNKVAGLRPVILLKKRLWHRCFPVNFAKFLRIPLVAASVAFRQKKLKQAAVIRLGNWQKS